MSIGTIVPEECAAVAGIPVSDLANSTGQYGLYNRQGIESFQLHPDYEPNSLAHDVMIFKVKILIEVLLLNIHFIVIVYNKINHF